jgi:hypothetical protein
MFLPCCLACAIPGTLASGMTRVKKTLAAEGCDLAASDVFYGGHSLGGAMMPVGVRARSLRQASQPRPAPFFLDPA